MINRVTSHALASVRTVSIIGAGSWGTSIAVVIAENRKDVTVRIWAHEKSVVSSINSRHENDEFLPGISLPVNIVAYNNLKDCVQGSDAVILATPSKVLYDISVKTGKYISRDAHIGYLSKGFCRIHNEVFTISQTISQTMPYFKDKVVAISGPSHAEEVSARFHTCLNVAGQDESSRAVIAGLLRNEYLQCRECADIIGVDLGGTLKNPAAIAAGMISILPKCGDNLSGALISEALKEMITLGRLFRLQDDIMIDISGLGDLVATALSDHSRNRRFGRDIARQIMQKQSPLRLYDRILLKLKPESVIERMSKKLHYLAEGAYAIEPLIELADRHNVSIPVYRSLYEVLLNKKDPTLLIETIKDPEKFEELYRKTKIHITGGKSGLEHIRGSVFRQAIVQRAADTFWNSDKNRDDEVRARLTGLLSAYAEGYAGKQRDNFSEELKLIRSFTRDNYNGPIESLVAKYADEMIDTHKSLVKRIYLFIVRHFLLKGFSPDSVVSGEIKAVKKIKKSENLIYLGTTASYVDLMRLLLSIDYFGLPFPRFLVDSRAVKGRWKRLLIRYSGGYIVDADKMANPIFREVLNQYISIMIEHGVPLLYFPDFCSEKSGSEEYSEGFFKVIVDSLYSYTAEIVLVPVSVTRRDEVVSGIHFHRPFKISDFTKPPFSHEEAARLIRLQWEQASGGTRM